MPETTGSAETDGLPAGVVELVRRLPPPEQLRRRCRALAMLDVLLSDDEGTRYFAYDAAWGPGEEAASMDDGCGNSWSVTFGPWGVWLRGFDHESDMSAYGEPHDVDWRAALPEGLRPAAAEPAHGMDEEEEPAALTVACWWPREGRQDEARWHPVRLRRDVPDETDDGAGWLFAEMLGDAVVFREFTTQYFEVDVALADVEHVLALGELSEELVRRFDPQRGLDDLATDVARIGYPQPA